jgi:flagellar basal body rod protein FlgC
MATGDVKTLADARDVVRSSFEVKHYHPQHPKAWNEAYVRYREVLGK